MSLFTSFVNNYQKLVDLEFVTKEMVLNYNVSNKRNFHSKLIYIFMKSAEENDYIAIPEIKIKYTKQPLNPKNYGITGKQQHQYKTDVALYKNRKLNGICEVFSFDMVANYLTMVERDNIHNLGKFTSTDKIIHLINNNLENEVDLYIIGVLPNNYEKKPLYADIKKLLKNHKNVQKLIEPQIDNLFKKLQKNCKSCNKIIITENGIHINNGFNKINY